MSPKPNLPDSIQLAHGSGGLMTRELLDEIVFTTFKNPYLEQKHDGAIVPLTGPVVISTDSFVVSPIFFRGGDIGELAVNGTVNDVAMCGGIPRYLSLGFIIEEGLLTTDFLKIVESIKRAADAAGVQVVTGDTKVVESGKGDKIFINTTGIGSPHPNGQIAMERIAEGDQILVSGPIAAHGMAILSEREGLEFESEIQSDTTNLNHLVDDLLKAFGGAIHLFRDPTRGGVSGVCSEIAQDSGRGVLLRETDFPIHHQVAAACEILGLDPLYVANEGILCAVVDGAVAPEVLAFMQAHPKGSGSACIGSIVPDHPGKVVMESSIGGKRIVTPLIGEQLPRIC
ncbi:hydrogenase expression/formation protein HypE [Robiginitalea aurantiaca]|uniref:Hydrogenase expression/formation protein HypE n=1 Tax=Robiginitalea aurantiaca TaxID=3056915 RepID=A0ABT7WB57_9FLAO|nr:hydrogenase expression/formation protein HypE [Robiginitalea aurantiaca]MDM9630148.1 hydrogenase expression/formation protein HypE [Robiginitalea aurantiaca]